MDSSSSAQALLPDITSPESAQQPPRAKSPPLAFEPTPNDALAPRINPDSDTIAPRPSTSSNGQTGGEDPLIRAMREQWALVAFHTQEACDAERRTWALERQWLHNRITNLEILLRAGRNDRYLWAFMCPAGNALS